MLKEQQKQNNTLTRDEATGGETEYSLRGSGEMRT
jgi:hypothetical protein